MNHAKKDKILTLSTSLSLSTSLREFSGLVRMAQKQEEMSVILKRISKVIGDEQSNKIYDDLKKEAASQHIDNGNYILTKLKDYQAFLFNEPRI